MVNIRINLLGYGRLVVSQVVKVIPTFDSRQGNMKILFLGTYLSKTTGTKGPGEFVASKLNEEGHQCLNISSRNNPLFRAVESIWYVLSGVHDVVVLEVYSSRIIYLTYLLSRLIRFRQTHYIAILHGGAIPERYDRIKPFLEPILKHASKCATPSNFIRQFFEARDRQLIYLPNPFPTENFPFSKTHSFPTRLLWIRAFSTIYNPTLAVYVLNEVRKHYPDVTLTMVGPDKGLRRETQDLMDSLDLKHAVEIVGPVPNEQLSGYFQSHSVYLNTTSYESFGLAVLEAAASGIPVVSTPAGEIPLLWQHEKDMLIGENWEPKALAAQVIRLIDDSALAEQLSINARKKAESFSWELIKEKWIKLLSN